MIPSMISVSKGVRVSKDFCDCSALVLNNDSMAFASKGVHVPEDIWGHFQCADALY